ncbi:HPr family phosphocarrier protein [Anaeroselena agilis]|uniref:Phosphocarrier protein HPr n=1 Tax=Anaeroselena agilis TaxID=3063788 RepID=A0ABU3NY41_9FIRM|nr:HPr family phosphocarrier protein [Selenomonadales bacterium 4137-cl]
MREQTLAITNKIGLHARPAALLVKTAAAYKSDITLVKGDKSVNAKSMLAIMSAGVKAGDAVTVRAAGEDEEQALEAVAALIKAGFNE